jgi:signal transduction histidine kinase
MAASATMSATQENPPKGSSAPADGHPRFELDPVLVDVQKNALRAMRVVGIAIGVLSLGVLGAQVLGLEPAGGSGPTAILVLGIVFGAVSLAAPVTSFAPLGAGLLIGALSLVAVIGLWTIGPSLPLGALLVVAPLIATFYFGKRVAVAGGAGVAVLLVGVFAASHLAGRPMVGGIPGARVPYPVYVELAVMTLATVSVALAAVYGALAAVERSIRRAREASDRERFEQERRADAERSLARAQRLEAIGHLAGGIAHDTRNALLVMSAGLRELRSSARSHEDQEVLADLEHAVSNLTHTAQQLLSLGRRPASAARQVALSEVVIPFVSALRRVIPPEVELRLEGQCDAQVVLDPARLEQALLNLALNARDAMPAGGVLTLRLAHRVASGEDRAVVALEDTGNGMDAPTASRIFEPFFTTKPAGSGTGLGLAIVQGFVAESGGTIELDSAPGRGTRVRLSFPVIPVARADATAAG